MAARVVAVLEGIEAPQCDTAASDAVGSGHAAERASAVPNECRDDHVPGCSGEVINPEEADGALDVAQRAEVQLSKNQQKKLKKQAAFEAKKATKKLEEKAAKRAYQERKLSEVQKIIADMSEVERQAWEEQMAQKRQV